MSPNKGHGAEVEEYVIEGLNSAIKIKSVQAADLFKANNYYKVKYKIDEEWKDFTYLKFDDAVINDSIFVKYARKHGVTVNKKGFSYDLLMIQFDHQVYKDDSNDNEIKQSMTSQELRDYYYENGATVIFKTYKNNKEILEKRKTVNYKMLYRSPGKAKEGHCIFVRERLHAKLNDYLTMGLWSKMPDKKGVDIVGLSAYAPLITATAISYMHIPIENIFVLKDESVSVKKAAFTVLSHKVKHKKKVPDYPAFEGYINDLGFSFYKSKVSKNPNLKYVNQSKKNLSEVGIDISKLPTKEVEYNRNECYVERNKGTKAITNILWDGMGLIDSSIFPEGNNGFIYCRSHFFKSCLFRGNIQEYFRDNCKDYENTYKTDMMGRKLKVSDIKVIITEKSLKWVKFVDLISKTGSLKVGFNYYERIMKKDGEQFAIVKTAHDSKYGDVQRSSFQINNTLPTTDKNELKKICKTTLDYFEQLKINNDAFIEYLKITGAKRYSIDNVLCDLYSINNDVAYTEYFKKKKAEILCDLKNNRIMLGKLFQNGDNLTICGNPIAMLMKVIGQDFMKENCFEQIKDGIQCYTSRYQEGEHIAAFRSPHNSPNNIVHLENIYPGAIRKYFPDLGNNVIIINGIGTDVQSRLNGQDLDTDFVFTTNQKEMVKLAKQAYLTYPTIINGIEPVTGNDYDKNMLSYSKMDSSISSSQYSIGVASNKAQLALSYYFDSGCKSIELEDVFIICSVLAQLAIDGTKKNFPVNVKSELERISRLSCMQRTDSGIKYPKFYAKVQKYNNRKKKRKYVIPDDEIGFMNCPMDIIYEIFNQNLTNLNKHKEFNTEPINMSEVFSFGRHSINANRKQCKIVKKIIENYQSEINSLNQKGKESYDSYNEKRGLLLDNCLDRLKNITIKYEAMEILVSFAFESGNEYLRDNLLIILYDKYKDIFLKCFKNSIKSHKEVS